MGKTAFEALKKAFSMCFKAKKQQQLRTKCMKNDAKIRNCSETHFSLRTWKCYFSNKVRKFYKLCPQSPF